MNIKAGICGLDEIEWFAEAGAKELYLGVSNLPSHVKNPKANIKRIEGRDLEASMEFLHSKGVRLFAAANDFNSVDIRQVIEEMLFLSEHGIDGFIVSSPEILTAYPKNVRQPEWHLSVVSACTNRRTLDWYHSLGIVRFTLFQQLLPSEAELLFDCPGVESEVFLNYGEFSEECAGIDDDLLPTGETCANFDGICRGCSGEIDFKEGKFCNAVLPLPDGSEFRCFKPDTETTARHIWQYVRKADWLKLVRKNTLENRKKILLFGKEIIKEALACPSEDEFPSIARKVYERFK